MSKKRLILLGIVALSIIFLPGYSKLQQLRAKNRALLGEINRLEKENEELVEKAKRLEEDPLYIEKKARDKMRMGKEGEIRYKIIYDEESN